MIKDLWGNEPIPPRPVCCLCSKPADWIQGSRAYCARHALEVLYPKGKDLGDKGSQADNPPLRSGEQGHRDTGGEGKDKRSRPSPAPEVPNATCT